jgi:hypothetical protein
MAAIATARRNTPTTATRPKDVSQLTGDAQTSGSRALKYVAGSYRQLLTGKRGRVEGSIDPKMSGVMRELFLAGEVCLAPPLPFRS